MTKAAKFQRAAVQIRGGEHAHAPITEAAREPLGADQKDSKELYRTFASGESAQVAFVLGASMPSYIVKSILEDGTGKRVGAVVIIDGEIAAIVSSYPRNDFNYDGTVGLSERLLSPFRAADAAFLNDAYHTAILQNWIEDPNNLVAVVQDLRNRANMSFVDLAQSLGDEAVQQVAINQLA